MSMECVTLMLGIWFDFIVKKYGIVDRENWFCWKRLINECDYVSMQNDVISRYKHKI